MENEHNPPETITKITSDQLVMRRYCGQDFSVEEQTQIRALIKNNPELKRTPLSREVCRILAWYKADGGLKAMPCRVAMLRMQDDGLICLPSSQKKRPSLRSKPVATSATDPERLITEPVHQLGDISLSLVKPSTTLLWNEYIERYHYLGHTTLPGAQLRYFVIRGDQIIALLGFGAFAWKIAPRDEFIGWNHDQRLRGLPLIVNNARFLILPWVQSKNLASKILFMIVRQRPIDWSNRYNLKPVFMETFVEIGRFTGTCYRAANWINPTFALPGGNF